MAAMAAMVVLPVAAQQSPWVTQPGPYDPPRAVPGPEQPQLPTRTVPYFPPPVFPGVPSAPPRVDIEQAPGVTPPTIAFDCPPTPMTAPVDVGGAGWGPFVSLAREESGMHGGGEGRGGRHSDHWHLTASQDAVGGGWRISAHLAGAIYGDMIVGGGGTRGPGVSFIRRDDGRVEGWSEMLGRLGIARQRVEPGASVELPGWAGISRTSTRPYRCTASGLSDLRGRAALVLACDDRPEREATGQPGRSAIRGMAAVDLATGLLLAQRYVLGDIEVSSTLAGNEMFPSSSKCPAR